MELLQTLLSRAEGVDVAILEFIQGRLMFSPLTQILTLLTHLADGGIFWIGLGVLLMITKKYRRAGALALTCMAIGAVITNLLLKGQVARIRPYEAYPSILLMIGPQMDYSFPSGHTCASFCSAFIYLRTLHSPLGTGTLVLAALIAFSRMYLGVHYPTDILGGLLVAALVSAVLLILFGNTAGASQGGGGGRSKRRRR